MNTRNWIVVAVALAVAVAAYVSVVLRGESRDLQDTAVILPVSPNVAVPEPTAAAEGWVTRPLDADDLRQSIQARLDPRRLDGFTRQDQRDLAEAAAELINLYRHGDLTEWQSRSERLGLAPTIWLTVDEEDVEQLWRSSRRGLQDAPIDLDGVRVYLRAAGGKPVEAPQLQLSGFQRLRQYPDRERPKPGDVDLATYDGVLAQMVLPTEMRLGRDWGYFRGQLVIYFAKRSDGQWLPVRVGIFGVPGGTGIAVPWI